MRESVTILLQSYSSLLPQTATTLLHLTPSNCVTRRVGRLDQAQRGNISGSYAQDLWGEIGHDLPAAFGLGFDRATNLHHAGSPGRQDIIDDERYTSMTERVAILLS